MNSISFCGGNSRTSSGKTSRHSQTIGSLSMFGISFIFKEVKIMYVWDPFGISLWLVVLSFDSFKSKLHLCVIQKLTFYCDNLGEHG